jgi:dihydrolipoamide dehydrogenase
MRATARRIGVQAQGVSFDFAAVQARKGQVMDTLRKGVAGLMKKFKVEVVNGRAKLKDRAQVGRSTATAYEAKNILIATGSSPARPPIPGLDLPGVVDSTGLLNLETLPDVAGDHRRRRDRLRVRLLFRLGRACRSP